MELALKLSKLEIKKSTKQPHEKSSLADDDDDDEQEDQKVEDY